MKVMASVAFKVPYLEMLPEFERVTGYRIETLWLPTVEIMSRLKGGEIVDLVALSASGIDELINLGKLKMDSRTEYLRSGIGVGIQKGATRPDLSTVDAFKHTLLSAKSIAYSTGPSGVYLALLLEKLGIAQTLQPKIKIIQGELVGAVIERGDAEIGFQQIPEILSVPRIDYVGPLPDEIQQITTFVFGTHMQASNISAINAWVAELRSARAIRYVKQYGLDPMW
jgi:molybdate transport system substrate-binding protein